MLEVIDGGKALFYQVSEEMKSDVLKRRQIGEVEWDILEYVIETCKDRGLKASEAAAVVYRNYRLRNE